MTRRLANAMRACVPCLALLLVVLPGCTNRAEHPGAGALPGALTKPLADYSPDEFRTFAQGLKYGGGIDHSRRCRKTAECDAGTGTTSARVDAVDGQDSLSAAALPANGVIVIQARNTGAHEEARYNLLPGTYAYYVVVLPTAGGGARWRMQQVTTTGAAAMTEVASGTVKGCGHTYVPNRKYRANFYTCDDAPASDSAVRLPLMLTAADSDPIWMSCSEGCCTLL